MQARMIKSLIIIVTCFFIASCGDSAKLQLLPSDAIILAFGDSLTYGTGTSRDKAYPAVLESLIQRKVINAGSPGEITEKALQRLPSLIKQYQPTLIILCEGGNDILRKLDLNKTKDNLQQMIDIARQQDIQLVIIAVPQFDLYLNASPIYRELADANKLVIENTILSHILGTGTLKSDHIHPNEKGYRLLAENIKSLLIKTGAIAAD